MLHLASETPAHWGRWAVDNIDPILLDHAHCERKAASNAINLIFRYTDHANLMAPLSALAREELEHFEEVLQHLARRGVTFERQFPSDYAGQLMKACRTDEPLRLLDTLLCASLIEARSCDRMQHVHRALQTAAVDPALTELYGGLLQCEARHHATYVDLARAEGIVPEAELRERLAELAAREATVMTTLPIEPRLHSRAPA